MKELSAPTTPTQSLTKLSQTVGSISGLPAKVVNQCQVWHSQQIRKLPMDVAAAAIGDQLGRLALQYGIREKPHPEVIKECVSLVGSEFSHLSPPELRVAWRQWASGKIDAKSAGEPYGGQISARQVGAILGAYSKARLEIMGRYLSAVGEAKEQEARAQREVEKKAAFEDKFQSDLQNAIETAQSYKDIPAYWFKILEDRGEIELTAAEKWEVYNSCEKYAIKEENERIDSNRGGGKLFEQIADRQNIQKVIAEREAVYRHYVLRKRPG